MNHLTFEALARLVDEPSSEEERRHLDGCARCRETLDLLREDARSLSLLPTLRPPPEAWDELEDRLRSEGLLAPDSVPATPERSPARHTANRPPARPGRWGARHPAVGAAAMLLVGMGLGVALPNLTGGVPANPTGAPDTVSSPPAVASSEPVDQVAWSELTLEEAEEMVRLSEEWYRASLLRYSELLESETGDGSTDPLTRYAVLEGLVAAGRAAVREAPTDPFVNGLLVNVHAERDAALRGIPGARPLGENWY